MTEKHLENIKGRLPSFHDDDDDGVLGNFRLLALPYTLDRDRAFKSYLSGFVDSSSHPMHILTESVWTYANQPVTSLLETDSIDACRSRCIMLRTYRCTDSVTTAQPEGTSTVVASQRRRRPISRQTFASRYLFVFLNII